MRARVELGLALGLALSLVGSAALAPAKSPAPPNVVLITIESLRPDYIASFEGERVTSQNLDALAAEAMVYTDAHSVTSWTLAAHASLFTGLYPTAHRATSPLSKLDDSYTTIAEILAENGYQCAGVVSGPYLRKAHNLHQGFELYEDSPSEVIEERAHADITNPDMELQLRAFVKSRRDAKRPFFLFAYFWDPHYDYIPPAPYDQAFVGTDSEPIDVTGYETTNKVNPSISPDQLRYVISQYEGEIAWTDALLGRFFRLLKDDGLWDDTLIVVTSDHGEEFFERGRKGHKNNLFRESVRVPLIVKYPRGGPRGRSSRLVSLVDVVPTILDATGARSSVPHQGRSLILPAPETERAIFFELLAVWYLQKPAEKKLQKKEEDWFAVRRGDYKLIAVPEEGRFELYNVREDPGERRDLAAREPGSARQLRAALAEWHSRTKAVATSFREGGSAELSPESLERLRSLGYLR